VNDYDWSDNVWSARNVSYYVENAAFVHNGAGTGELNDNLKQRLACSILLML